MCVGKGYLVAMVNDRLDAVCCWVVVWGSGVSITDGVVSGKDCFA